MKYKILKTSKKNKKIINKEQWKCKNMLWVKVSK